MIGLHGKIRHELNKNSNVANKGSGIIQVDDHVNYITETLKGMLLLMKVNELELNLNE